MRNYRLRLLREKLDLQQGIKPLAEAARDKAKNEEDAARRQLKFRTNLERQLHEKEDERTKAGCRKLLKETPALDVLEKNLELAKRKLSSTIRLVRWIEETETRFRAETLLTKTVEAEYSHALQVLREQFGDIEVVYKLNERKQQLDIFFGGQEFPLGVGHAHWVYRRNRCVVRRNPKSEPVAC